HGGELRPPCGRRLGQRLARGPGVLEVALGVQPEVLGREIVALEPIVLDEPRELRSRDRRLGRLDRVEDRERPETLVRRPGRRAWSILVQSSISLLRSKATPPVDPSGRLDALRERR